MQIEKLGKKLFDIIAREPDVDPENLSEIDIEVTPFKIKLRAIDTI